MIREVIVVEGRDDITAVKNALEAEVIATGGYGYDDKFIQNLRGIAERRGLIILTDPDYAGERIRMDISRSIDNCKHAFLPQGKALMNGDIGVENATKGDIIEAVSKAKPMVMERREEFSRMDLMELGLIGGADSRRKREYVGNALGIGYANSKQFLNRLNNFGIAKKELIQTLNGMEDHDE
ncbi:MAG: ribonuclease M5 [Tissierellia bacterium]|nr:ribonuclease M5 [Tissierellia bacterium]